MKAKSIPIDSIFGEMMNSAVRYALGRRTYVVMDTCKYIKPLIPYLDNRTLYCIVRDIQEQEHLGGYGDDCDKVYWMMLLDDVENELSGRVDETILSAIG